MREILALIIISAVWLSVGYCIGNQDLENDKREADKTIDMYMEHCNQILEVSSKQNKLLEDLVNENKEYRRVLKAYETAIKRWDEVNAD